MKIEMIVEVCILKEFQILRILLVMQHLESKVTILKSIRCSQSAPVVMSVLISKYVLIKLEVGHIQCRCLSKEIIALTNYCEAIVYAASVVSENLIILMCRRK